MKLREIYRLELAQQARGVSTWLYPPVLFAIAFLIVQGNYIYDAREGYFVLNSPFVIALVTVLSSMAWLLIAAPVAGMAAARDVQARIHPLIFAAPVGKGAYLGGRFLAAFTVNAAVMLAPLAGILFAIHGGGAEPEILGPFQPLAHLSAYFLLALPNALIATAIQFTLAALSRRAIAAYLGSVILFVASYLIGSVAVGMLARRDLGALVDPMGFALAMEITGGWSSVEANTRLVPLEGWLLANRLIWTTIAFAALALAYNRFRFAHVIAASRWWRRRKAPAPAADAALPGSVPISVPRVTRTFALATHARQLLAIAAESIRQIAASRGSIAVPLLIAAFIVLIVPLNMNHMGIPMVPTTEYVLGFLTMPLAGAADFVWAIVPLATIFYAGELVWREREAGLGEIAGSAPVPEWALLLGKFLGLACVLAAWMALLALAGMLVQLRMGHYDLEPGLLLSVLLGLQLADYLLFALLAIAIHVVVNRRFLGYLVALLAYGVIAYSSMVGIEHNLLVYGGSPDWSYTEMRGFGPTLMPWLWFKLYWIAWALLLAVAARLLWVRGKEGSVGERLRLASGRLTRATAGVAAAGAMLVVALGGFIFYNTNVLNTYSSASDLAEWKADYERAYGRFADDPQPRLTDTRLRVELYPERRAAEIEGSYRLVNDGPEPIRAIHVATAPDVQTGAIAFDRPASPVVVDDQLGHRTYTLAEPLKPGETLRLTFDVHVEALGFGNAGGEPLLTENGSYFWNDYWLPAVGYQQVRELYEPSERKQYGLAPRPPLPAPDAPGVGAPEFAHQFTAFEAVIGTSADEVAVAPGVLREAWSDGGRRYFRYSTDAPIRNEYAMFSADYAVHETQWDGVLVQIFHHPGHGANLESMASGGRAALDYYGERFGPYPYRRLKLVEQASSFEGLHADAGLISYKEGFSRFDPAGDPRKVDLVSAIVAHEVAHQWWGNQLVPAFAQGSGVLGESFAWYSAIGAIERAQGGEGVRRFLGFLREAYDEPRPKAAPPLLRATDWYLSYRKGPLALYALSQYIGEERVNLALRRLLDKNRSGAAPLPTSLDLYREVKAVTPPRMRPLLHDLFAANIFWELETNQATARPAGNGWQVTLDVTARKSVVDEEGVEKVLPMRDWVQVGVYAPGEQGERGKPLYLKMHRVRSGEQTITVAVPRKPATAGIDPEYLLIDWKTDDNVVAVEAGGQAS